MPGCTVAGKAGSPSALEQASAEASSPTHDGLIGWHLITVTYLVFEAIHRSPDLGPDQTRPDQTPSKLLLNENHWLAHTWTLAATRRPACIDV